MPSVLCCTAGVYCPFNVVADAILCRLQEGLHIYPIVLKENLCGAKCYNSVRTVDHNPLHLTYELLYGMMLEQHIGICLGRVQEATLLTH